MKRILFLLNSIVVFISLCAWVISYIPPTKLHFINYCSLLMPVLLLINVFFASYWLLQLNKKSLLSIIFLLLSVKNLQRLYGVSFLKSVASVSLADKPISIMSYNSRQFSSEDEHTVFYKEFIKVYKDSLPDVLLVQETLISAINKLKKEYPYASTKTKDSKKGSNFIVSKYPIINEGLIRWKDKQLGRDAAFVDLKIENDTIRFYSIHLSSYKFSKNAEQLQKRGGKSILKRFSKVFKYQEQQVNKIKEHIADSPYPVIIGGDFNNNAFSYVYKELLHSSDLKDTFVEVGKGFGATYDFSYFPTRIDFIFVPTSAQVFSHRIERHKAWSDHFPVIVKINL